jgi:HPt (histidine-containing phosphotransfer) domain-containing protein
MSRRDAQRLTGGRAQSRARERASALRDEVHRVASMARALGLASLAAVVIRMGEQLESALRAGDIGPRDRQWLRRCSEQCCAYLRDMQDVTVVDALLERLSAASALSAAERLNLLRGLLAEGAAASHERSASGCGPGRLRP